MQDRIALYSAALWLAALLLGCGGGASPSNDAGPAGSGGEDGSASGSVSDGSSGPPGDADAISSCGGNNEPCCPLPSSCNAGLVCGQTSDGGNRCGPPREAGPDAACITSCTQMGGQYCGYIGNGCGCRPVLDCGKCANPDFTCGGAGISRLCGAPRDSGACEVTICKASTGQYCGVIGDGCGAALDCGGCPPGMWCGGGGVPRVCGAPPDLCTPVLCNQPTYAYCGRIGDGCGRALDCEPCPDAQICGELVPNVCGSPAQSLPPPPPPRDPPPSAPPPRAPPICPDLP
ncbi:MAG TPA: hypothetical protein VK550_31355 [Polyangiaceae bacterium]|nr:hypothetical protein [Polyangiaceae bacterium]